MRNEILFQYAPEGSIFHPTLPNNNNGPPKLAELLLFFLVSSYISSKFLLPVGKVGFGHVPIAAIYVMMPETAVDKDHRLVFGQDYIWFSWQIRAVQSEAKAIGEQPFSHSQLW